MPVELDVSFFSAPCCVIEADYKDIMGQNIAKISLTKFKMTKDRKTEHTPYKFKPGAKFSAILDDALKYPGCRVFGKFDKIYKAKGEIHFNFLDDYSSYIKLTRTKKLDINLGFKINSFTFGDPEIHRKIISELKPFFSNIESEMTPFLDD